MIKIIFKTAVFFLLVQASYGSTYTLNSILRSAAKNTTLDKALQQQSLALEAKNRANTAYEPIKLFGEGSRANPIIGGSGNEYVVGVSKKILFGNIHDQEQKMARLSNQATLLEEEKNILNFKNGLKNIYHQHCLDTQNYRSFEQSYQAFKKLYNKKQKAYKYQEISKTELMQLEIEKNSLFAQLQEIKMQQNISKQHLFMLSKLPYNASSRLSCKDMYPIRTQVKLGTTFKLSREAYDKRIQSTKEALNRYSHEVDSINLSAQYTNELDVDKYTIGFSLPLNFTSEKSEEERAAAMYQNSAIAYKHAQTMTEKKSLLVQMQSQLKGNALMVKTLTDNYRNYQKNLLPLIQKSYDLGETSVIEYLLNKQRSYQLRQEIYTTKKAYYKTLFRLYTISEKKDTK